MSGTNGFHLNGQSNNRKVIIQPRIHHGETSEQTLQNFRDVLEDVVVANFQYTRADMVRNGKPGRFDFRRDLDTEYGYPESITPEDYDWMFERDPIANRVVSALANDTWGMGVEVYETEEQKDTKFEKAVKKLNRERNLFSYLQRGDIVSGIGSYGIMVLGFDDGGRLDSPLFEGDDEEGGLQEGEEARKLMWIRVFQESLVTIKEVETDENSPRNGMPKVYTVKFAGVDNNRINPGRSDGNRGARSTTVGRSGKLTRDQDVHWTRVVHLADNRVSSEIGGIPRMKPVFNRLLDLRKITGGSAEMMFRGALPGLSFETTPDVTNSEIKLDTKKLKRQFDRYSNSTQRYLATVGIKVRSLAPQVADPSKHVEVQLSAIAIQLSIPLRILLGSEAAQLASGQDSRTYNKRIASRQDNYADPYIIRPFFNRLIRVGALPEPKDGYYTYWPDLNAPTDQDVANTASSLTTALASYYTSGACDRIPLVNFLTDIFKWPIGLAEAVDAAAKKHEETLVKEGKLISANDVLPPPGDGPPPPNGNKPRSAKTPAKRTPPKGNPDAPKTSGSGIRTGKE